MRATMLRELRCPSCTAPVDAGQGQATVCRYCGATLVPTESTTIRGARSRSEDRFLVVLRVGPSNLDRVARVLHETLGIDLGEARELVTRSPCEISAGGDEGTARHVARAATEAGAQAEVTAKAIAIPIVTVRLEQTGEKKAAVIIAIREHIELGVIEAKRLVETAPCTLIDAMDEPKAKALAAALEAAGASVRLSP